jgi:hypothetical protein
VDYFPKTARDAIRTWKFLEDDLQLLGEPSFLDLSTQEQAFRLLWEHAFQGLRAIRVERADNLCLVTVRQTMGYRVQVFPSFTERTMELPEARWQQLVETAAFGFWEMASYDWPAESLEGGRDGQCWTLEGRMGHRYHVVYRSSTAGGQLHHLGRELIGLMAPE